MKMIKKKWLFGLVKHERVNNIAFTYLHLGFYKLPLYREIGAIKAYLFWAKKAKTSVNINQ